MAVSAAHSFTAIYVKEKGKLVPHSIQALGPETALNGSHFHSIAYCRPVTVFTDYSGLLIGFSSFRFQFCYSLIFRFVPCGRLKRWLSNKPNVTFSHRIVSYCAESKNRSY